MQIFDLMSMFEGGIDLNYMNPKIAGKIIWMYTNNMLRTELTNE